MSDTRELFLSAVDLVDEQVAAFAPHEWGRPSPCEGWDARHVLVHVTGTLAKVLAMFESGQYAAPPASVEAPDAQEAVRDWAGAAASVRKVIATADPEGTVETLRGQGPLAMGLALPTADCAVHAWDLAAAAGRSLDLPTPHLRHVRTMAESIPDEQLRATSFGPAVAPPEEPSETDQLMAWLGRSRPQHDPACKAARSSATARARRASAL